MTLNEYQTAAKQFAFYPKVGGNLAYPTLGLAGEAGEVANEVKKVYRDDAGNPSMDRTSKIFYELGDVLWYLASLASEMNFTLDEIAESNIKKLTERRKASGR